MDEFVSELQDRGKAVWLAKLDSGAWVWMDDGRPGMEPPSAWMRLKSRLAETGERIVSLSLRFRSHIEDCLPQGAPGYFFAHSVMRAGGDEKESRFMLVGHVEGGKLHVQRWVAPELILMGSEERVLEESDFLILNPGAKPNGC